MILIRGLRRGGHGGDPRGTSGCRDEVAVSLARRRRRPARRRCRPGRARRGAPRRRRDARGATVLPVRTRMPRRPTRLARRPRRPAGRRRPSRIGGPRQALGRDRPRGRRRPAEDGRRRLAEDPCRRPVANSSPTTNAAGVEGRARSASATTGCGASPRSVGAALDEPERDVDVPVREVVAARRR